ncbi:MAG: helix-turn-helix transcriptional regulator [Verrucomicrobiota bacterium]
MKKSSQKFEQLSEINDVPFRPASNYHSPLEVLDLKKLKSRKIDHCIYQPHRLGFHLLKFTTKGTGLHWIDFRKTPVRKGDIIHIHPSQVHHFDKGSSHEALLVVFHAAAIPFSAHLSQISLRAASTIRPSTKGFQSLIELVGFISRLQSSKDRLNQAAMAPGLIGAILAGVNTAGAEFSPTTSAEERLWQFVTDFNELAKSHCVNHRSVTWYATKLGVSGRTLSRACLKIQSRRPKEFIDHYLVLEAQRQLVLTRATVDEIGSTLGFSEATNFVKFFKRLTGRTPVAFRSNPIKNQKEK